MTLWVVWWLCLRADDDVRADRDGVRGIEGGDDALESAVAVGIEDHVDAGGVGVHRQMGRPIGRGDTERVEEGIEIEEYPGRRWRLPSKALITSVPSSAV